MPDRSISYNMKFLFVLAQQEAAFDTLTSIKLNVFLLIVQRFVHYFNCKY